jgi:hypothetical protein
MPRWRVDYLGKKGSHLGMVEAAGERSAIVAAATRRHAATRSSSRAFKPQRSAIGIARAERVAG